MDVRNARDPIHNTVHPVEKAIFWSPTKDVFQYVQLDTFKSLENAGNVTRRVALVTGLRT